MNLVTIHAAMSGRPSPKLVGFPFAKNLLRTRTAMSAPTAPARGPRLFRQFAKRQGRQALKHSACMAAAGAILAAVLPAAGLAEATSAPAGAVPGGVYLLPLPPEVDSASYAGRRVLIHSRRALVGIPVDATPGEHALSLKGPSGTRIHRFTVAPKQYPEEHLTIANERMVHPSEADLARIRSETERQLAQYRRFTMGALDLTPFNQPVAGRVSSVFGQRRVLNGQPRNPHSGLDLAADAGTPIQAPAPATVAMTGDLYFNGKTLFLDHGQGLVTMYCHLSAIAVREGDAVARGQVLGQVGMTGRTTGPHLHWSVSLNGNRVDPVQVMAALNAEAPARP